MGARNRFIGTYVSSAQHYILYDYNTYRYDWNWKISPTKRLQFVQRVNTKNADGYNNAKCLRRMTGLSYGATRSLYLHLIRVVLSLTSVVCRPYFRCRCAVCLKCAIPKLHQNDSRSTSRLHHTACYWSRCLFCGAVIARVGTCAPHHFRSQRTIAVHAVNHFCCSRCFCRPRLLFMVCYWPVQATREISRATQNSVESQHNSFIILNLMALFVLFRDCHWLLFSQNGVK